MLPQALRDAVLDLCVLNEPINPTLYPKMCEFLDRIGRICEADWAHYQTPKLTLPKAHPKTDAVSKLSDDVTGRSNLTFLSEIIGARA